MNILIKDKYLIVFSDIYVRIDIKKGDVYGITIKRYYFKRRYI